MRYTLLLFITVFCFLMTAAPIIKVLPKPLLPQPGALKLDYAAGSQGNPYNDITLSNTSSSTISSSSCNYCPNISPAGLTIFPVFSPATNMNQTEQLKPHRNTSHHRARYYGHGKWQLAADGRYWWQPTPYFPTSSISNGCNLPSNINKK